MDDRMRTGAVLGMSSRLSLAPILMQHGSQGFRASTVVASRAMGFRIHVFFSIETGGCHTSGTVAAAWTSSRRSLASAELARRVLAFKLLARLLEKTALILFSQNHLVLAISPRMGEKGTKEDRIKGEFV